MSLTLVVAPVALSLRDGLLRGLVVIRAQRAADVHLVLRELALRITAHVPLVALVRLDQLALRSHNRVHHPPTVRQTCATFRFNTTENAAAAGQMHGTDGDIP